MMWYNNLISFIMKLYVKIKQIQLGGAVIV